MRVTIQRVLEASVMVEETTVGEIKKGLLIFLGIENNDSSADIEWLSNKICKLRIFPDNTGDMNKNILDIRGEVLIISQFTLFASIKKGSRPSFKSSGKPEFANKMCAIFTKELSYKINRAVATGIFGTDMKVSLINDGPVTINIDTKKKE